VLGTYYLAQFPAFGKMVDAPPLVPRSLSTRIGVGLSPTTLLLVISPTSQNLADLTFQASGSIGTGQVARVAGANAIGRAVSDVSRAQSQAIGLDAIPFSAVQLFGKIVLSPTQWATITNTGGLVAGTAYYDDTSARPGHLTSIAPEAGFGAQVGVALSTTTLLLSIPSFPRAL
jgi:hypothetical protein